jgi:TRAP-type C4-dicarboxylate transport system permease small subunit
VNDTSPSREPRWALPLRTLDRSIYQVEQWIVTIAACLMTLTVSLDILYRALKGQSSFPLGEAFTLFGLLEAEGASQSADTLSLSPFVAFIIFSFGLGWTVYLARHRGEEGAQRAGLKWGGVSLVGIYLFCVFVRNAPSSWVCGVLIATMGGAGGFASLRAGRGRLSAITFVSTGLGVWVCRGLPQDYIWSQELSLILLAWVAFLGGSMATYQNKHIQISALAKAIPERYRPWVRPVSLFATALFSAYLATLLSINVFGEKGSFFSGEIRPATQLPAWLILTSAVIAFSLISARGFFYSILTFMNPHDPPQEEALH